MKYVFLMIVSIILFGCAMTKTINQKEVLMKEDRLIFHFEFVDALLQWLKERDEVCIDYMVGLPATQFMQQIIYQNVSNDIPSFKEILKRFDPKDDLVDDIYVLRKAYESQSNIKSLLYELRNKEFTKGIYERVIRYFPVGYTPPRNYEVFFSGAGWHWGDAHAFRYVVNDGKYVLSGEGIPAIMFNLTLVSDFYGDNTGARINNMIDTMAHELFHAIFFDAMKYYWPSWDNSNFTNNILWIIMNEGIAHLIMNSERLLQKYKTDDNLKGREIQAFATLNEYAKLLFNDKIEFNQRREAAMKGVAGDQWSRYLCIAGMFMAFQIEKHYGIEGIRDTIKNGPIYFLNKYNSIQKSNTELPELPIEIIKLIKQ